MTTRLVATLPLLAAALAAQQQDPPATQDTQPAAAHEHLQVRVGLALGAGKFEHTTSGSAGNSGKTDAGYLRFDLEFLGDNDFGGGLTLEGTHTDDDLFDAAGIRSRADDAELFLHGTGMFRGEHIEAPVRFGLFIRDYTTDDLTTDASVDWRTVGLRLETTPAFTLVDGGGVRWSLDGRFGFAIGRAQVSSDPATFKADSSMAGLDLGIGTHLRLRPVEFGVDYLYRSVAFDQSEHVNGLAYARADGTFTGLLLSMAVRF